MTKTSIESKRTLKQLLKENQIEACTELMQSILDESDLKIIELVKEWLMQKRQEYPLEEQQFGDYFRNKAKLSLIDELLEELQPKEGANK